MHDAPVVSIAMPMRNAGLTLTAALASIRQQQFETWELLIVDDGSTDASVEIARKFCDPRFIVMADRQHRGLAARLNQAVAVARGRYFARMDADDIAYPERLAKQLQFLEAHQSIDLLGAGMMVFGQDGAPLGRYPVQTTHEQICAQPYSGFHMAHPTWIGPIGWFRRWPYDANCAKAQDQELLLRAYRHSRFAALADILMGYRQERPTVRKSLVGRYYFSRAVLRDARREHKLAMGAAALTVQVAKGSADVLAIATGLERFLLRHRALRFPPEEGARWREVWSGLTDRRSAGCAP